MFYLERDTKGLLVYAIVFFLFGQALFLIGEKWPHLFSRNFPHYVSIVSCIL